jgi:hypothetical protein
MTLPYASSTAVQRIASVAGMDADAQIIDARAALSPLPAQSDAPSTNLSDRV